MISMSFSSIQYSYNFIGTEAPNFSSVDQDGLNIQLKDYLGKYVILYFFPKAFTPGWTKQACGFRDQYKLYQEHNIEIIGISYDTRDRQKSFSEK